MASSYKGITNIQKLEECRQIAIKNNGKCLASIYSNNKNPLLWECEKGHIWPAAIVNVRRGKWCPDCSGNRKLSIDDCAKLAISRGGLCLSTEYINATTKYIWQCKSGHIWPATFNNVKSKNCWCPICSSGFGEKLCRIFFEKFFGASFIKIRPDYLISDKGKRLELDGFNEELKIAFEYQGIQHYEIDGFFNKNKKQLDKIIQVDRYKKRMCQNHGVKLIIIPYFISVCDVNTNISILNNLLETYGFTTSNLITISLEEILSFNNKIGKI
jgi:hypothetical protein